MQLYGKFINETEVEFAQQNYNNIINFNTNIDLMKQYGFKQVEDTPMPDFDESYQKAIWKWLNDDDTIVKEWTIVEYRSEEERKRDERERLDNLELTGSDVERAIYETKGMDFDDLVIFVESLEIPSIDIKRLKIELRANHFVRKHPYINTIGALLGYTSEDMDYLFENKKFPEKESPSDTQEVNND